MKTVLCFGDSNTWGHHAPLGDRFDENTRWGSRLRTLLGEDYRVIEEGQRGRTTVWDDPVENRLAGLTYLWPCLDSHAPIDLVVIMLGTNDCKPYFGLHPQNIADGAGRLVDMVQKCAFGPNDTAPKVLLVSQPTRGVDIGAIEYIHQQLIDIRDSGAAVLLVSADLDEVRTLSDRIVVLYEGEIVNESMPGELTEVELGLLMTGSKLPGKECVSE